MDSRDHITVDWNEVDWNEQAAKAAQNHLSYSSFSHSSLVDQLEFEGFTPEQAEYGVSTTGLQRGARTSPASQPGRAQPAVGSRGRARSTRIASWVRFARPSLASALPRWDLTVASLT